jgi:putative acetyltransferase
MEGVTIRAAQASDYKDIAEIMACPGVVYWTMQLPYISLDQRKQWLEGLTPNDYMLVAEVGGKVVGQIDLSRSMGAAPVLPTWA